MKQQRKIYDSVFKRKAVALSQEWSYIFNYRIQYEF
jgi:hypothetical protein